MTDPRRILARIADALGIPMATFAQLREVSDEQGTAWKECAELLEAFQRIGDRQARRRCLTYVKATADRSADKA
ncbi:hypothetical protein [Methylobacterium sp.]|uniref:hypothetical protein n=1 Tax=Methylobacterium sp. TaxID=409 RepID=UPI000C4ED577|nr:hypothetical protein [Methylobacterium sp.]MBP28914.1 hypothetical protein [Methylobacterium sp.]